jgi:hypothetical protein
MEMMKVCMDVDLLGAPAWLRSALFGVVTMGMERWFPVSMLNFPLGVVRSFYQKFEFTVHMSQRPRWRLFNLTSTIQNRK